jgi:hypothetical protein
VFAFVYHQVFSWRIPKPVGTHNSHFDPMALSLYGPDIVTATAHSTHALCQDLLGRSLGTGAGGGIPSSLVASAQHVVIAHDLFMALAIVMKYRVLLLSSDEKAPAGLYAVQQLEKRWLRERHSTPGGGRFDVLATAVLQGDFTETHICQAASVAARGLYGAREYDGAGPDGAGPDGVQWHVYVRRDFLLLQGRVVNMLRGFMAAARDGTGAELGIIAAALGVGKSAVQTALEEKLAGFIAACDV